MFKKLLRYITKNKLSFSIVFIGILMISISLGSAILTKTLSIGGKTKIDGCGLNIHFEDIEISPESVKNADSSNDAKIVDSERQNIEFSTNLSSLDEKYEFTVYTVNDGCMDAMIDSVEKRGLTDELKEYVSFDVVYDDSNISVNDTYYSNKYVNFNNRNYYVNRELSGRSEYCDPLFEGTRRKIKVTVKLKKELEDDESLSLNLGFKINYVQVYDCSANILTIDPNGGTYDNKVGATKVSLNKDSEYTVIKPKKGDQEFLGWEIVSPTENGTYRFEDSDTNGNRKFIMGDENVTIRAKWNEEIREDFVARIMDTYYTTIQKAFDEVDFGWQDNTVFLLKDTTEKPTNNALDKFKFNLGTHTVTGTIINPSVGDITLMNGKIIAYDDNNDETIDATVLNYGKLTLSDDNEEEVEVENSISLRGLGVGVLNYENAILDIKDGYIEALNVGDNEGVAYLFTNEDDGNDKVFTPKYYFVAFDSIENGQRAYVTREPNRKVVKTTTNSTIFYETLQLAINTVSSQKKFSKRKNVDENYYKIYAIRDFDAPNVITIDKDDDIYFDLLGYNVSIGSDVNNNGNFNILNSNINPSTISLATTINNVGKLNIDNVDISTSVSYDAILNHGYLNINNSTISAVDGYGIVNDELTITADDENTETPLRIKLSDTTTVKSDNNYGIYNKQNDLVLDAGTVYGLLNDSSAEMKESAKLYTAQKVSKNEFINALVNSKNNSTFKINGGSITSNKYTDAILNAGKITMNSGTIYSVDAAINQRYSDVIGEITINGGTIDSTERTIYRGSVILNGGTVHSVSNIAIYAKVTMNDDSVTVISDEGTAIYAYDNSTINKGNIIAKNYGITISSSSDANIYINGGNIKSENIGIYTLSDSYNINVSDGNIEGKNVGISAPNVIVSGGTIVGSYKPFGEENPLATSIGIVGGGVITGGEIIGDLYGIQCRNKLTLGVDDYNEENGSPNINNDQVVVRGNSYGVYINSEFSFYDGVIEGTIDGYSGEIIGSPIGSFVSELEPIEIDGQTYIRKVVSTYSNWLRVGDIEYNNINAASSAIENEGTIEVIADATMRFEQTFINNENNDKKIIFDLNGHNIATTQNILNNVDLTIIDSSDNKTGQINLDVSKEYSSNSYIPNGGIINNKDLTINGGSYSGVNNAIIDNRGTLVINDATLNCSNQIDRNHSNDISAIYSSGFLTINNININNSMIGITNKGSVQFNDGVINSKNSGISGSNVVIDGGEINSDGYGIEANSITVNGGKIESNTKESVSALTVIINDGDINSISSIAVCGRYVTINNGNITGKYGIENACKGTWGILIINGGQIYGRTHGLFIGGGIAYIYGGTITSDKSGIYIEGRNSEIEIGKNDGNVSVNSPMIMGDEYAINAYDYNYRQSIKFYDGILKSKGKVIKGFIYKIPNNTAIKEDSEFINDIKYNTQYLSDLDNWIRVGNQEFSSINDAVSVMDNGDTMTVIANPYVGAEQIIPDGKDVYLDLNGHSIILTTPITINGKLTITDNTATENNYGGSINNIRDYTIYNNGELIIQNGALSSDEGFAIYNNSELVMNGGLINSAGGILNETSATFTINGGTINSNGLDLNKLNKIPSSTSFTNIYEMLISNFTLGAITTNGDININGGNINSFNNVDTINVGSGTININGGRIISEEEDAISMKAGHIIFNMTGGYIEAMSNGIDIYGGEINSANILGGEIKANDTGIKSSSNNLVVTGGKIYGVNYGIVCNEFTVGNNDGTISINSPEIKSENIAISTHEFNFYDGILVGNVSGEQEDVFAGEIGAIPNDTELEYGSRVENDKTYITLNLTQEREKAINIQTGVRYTNLQQALDEVEENQTVKILTDFSIFSDIKNTNSNKFTLDMDGHKIITNKQIINNGNMNIISLNTDKGVLQSRVSEDFIVNNGVLSFDNIKVIHLSKYSNSVIINKNELSLNNFEASSEFTVILNNGKLSVADSNINATSDFGVYKKYAISSLTTKDVNISNSTINTFSSSSTLSATKNNNIYFDNVKIDYFLSLFNGGTLNIDNNSRINGSIDINKSIVNINNSYVYDNYLMSKSSSKIGIDVSSNATLNINNSTIDLTNSSYLDNNLIAIFNEGSLDIRSSSIKVGGFDSSTISKKVYTGIESKSGTTNIQNTSIDIVGGKTTYGINLSGQSEVTMPSGSINVNKAIDGYGLYAQNGSFTYGENDNVVYSEKDLYEVPKIYVSASNTGIGVKKTNGSFGFFDGIVYASSSAIPETVTSIASPYEVTTYIEESSGFQYSVLENINDDYKGDAVALLNNVYYNKIQDAINKANNGDEIKILQSTTEDIIVNKHQDIIVNLNGKNITTTIANSGTLRVYNGLLQNVDETVINNNGTFIMGTNDGVVSSSNIKIASEVKSVINNGTFIMYDGYIDGNPPLEGEINEIAEHARIYDLVDEQKTRKYIQGLTEEDILNGDVELYLFINPSGGTYNGSKDIQKINLKHGVSYILDEPTKDYAVFAGWQVSDPDVLDNNVIRMNLQDVTITATWNYSPNVVARIGEDYYLSLSEAIDAAKDGDVVTLLKDTNESITNDKNITLDLGSKEISNQIINNGTLHLINGLVEKTDGTPIINNGTLILGEDDGFIKSESIKIYGYMNAVKQNGILKFYDGYIKEIFESDYERGTIIDGTIDIISKDAFLASYGTSFYNEGEKYNCIYVVAKEESVNDAVMNTNSHFLYSNLERAIDEASDGDTLIILSDFTKDEAYILSKNILINLNGYDITFSDTFTIDSSGSLKIFDLQNTKGSVSVINTIENNGNLEIDDVTLQQMSDNITIDNNGHLKLNNATVTSTTQSTINSTGTIEVLNDTLISSNEQYGIINNQDEKMIINGGTISSIYNYKDLELDGNIIIDNNSNTNPAIYLADSSSLLMNNGTINSKKNGITINSNNNVTIKNGNISTSNNSIVLNGNASNINLMVEGGTIESLDANGIYGDTRDISNKITITKGTIIGSQNGIQTSELLDISDGTVISKSLSASNYALKCYFFSNCIISGNAKFESDRASGISISNSATINGGKIYSGATDGVGLMVSSSKTINISENTKIKTTGINSYGINTSSSSNLTIDNVDIVSENIGISHNSSGSISVNLGSIVGNTYGIIINNDKATLNIGSEDDNLSIIEPYISGGAYGVYNQKGNVNFYNGKLRGSTKGYRGDFQYIRNSSEIAEVGETDETINSMLTFSTSSSSINPISDTAKEGNGYAKITYIGDSESCEINEPYEYDYKGLEVTFNTPCTGKYKLEVWGAQGGSNSTRYNGGYGGYSTGEIDLDKDEILYINVGGKGNITPINANSVALGGYNGGGDAMNDTTDGTQVGSGGGATHIASSSGVLSRFESNRNSIIIVAGGGGGINGSKNYSTIGNGGGYQGSVSATDSYNSLGGTQNSGYAFGQAEMVIENNKPGAGGGYYSGYSGLYTAGGGSGYIGSSRLENAYMYGYNVKTTIPNWVNNFLVEKDNFLQVGSETFNSFSDAIESIDNTGTIILLKNSINQQVFEIPSDKNITLDLNGHNLDVTTSIVNNGILNIINSDGSNNYINNTLGNTLINNGDLTINGVIINSSNIGINNNVSNHSIVLNNTNINTTGSCIYLSNNDGNNIQITDSHLTSTSESIIETSNKSITENNTVLITDSQLAGYKYALNLYYVDLNIDNSTLSSQNNSVINLNKCSANILNQSNISSSTAIGLSATKSEVIISNSTIEIDGNKYAIDLEGVNTSDTSTVNINNNSLIKSRADAIYYKGNSSTININNSNVTSTEGSAIEFSNNSTYNRILNINSGTIIGNTYGVHVIGNNTTLNIGSNNYNSTIEPSVENPYISGDTYGIYKESGTTNFYEGRIRGKEDGFSGDFNSVRTGMKIYDTFEYDVPGDSSTKYIVNYLGEQEGYLKVGNKSYNTFAKAIEALGDSQSGTIKVVGNIEIQDDVTIDGNVIVLDLNGHKLTMADTITNNANLTIIDSQTDGTIKGNGSSVIINNNSLTISSGKIEGRQNGIYTNTTGHTLDITGGNIETIGYAIYYDTAGYNNTLTISGGDIVSTGSYAIYSNGNTGKINTINISGGTIKGATYGTYLKYAKGNITGGTFSTTSSNTSNYAVYLASCSNLYFKTGSIISSENANGLYIASGTIYLQGVQINNYADNSNGLYLATGTINISNNTNITSKNLGNSIKITGGTITINDVNINSENIGINVTGGTLNLNSGTIEGLTYGIYSTKGTINIGSSSNSLSIETPLVIGETYGVYKDNNGNYNFYNGKIKGKSGINNVEFNTVRSNYYVKEEKDEDNYYVGTLTELTNVIKNKTTDIEYTTLSSAINALKTGEELELIGDVYNYDAITIKSGITATIDLNGYNISTSKAITNNGILTIKSSKTKSNLSTGLSITLITNANSLTIENVHLSSGATCIKNNASMTLNVTNSDVISTTIGIDNSGIMNIDSSNISGDTNAITSNTSSDSIITNSTLTSENNAISKSSATDNTTTITGTTIYGKILLSKANETLIINNSDLRNGFISNSGGTITINGNTMTNYYVNSNSGNLTIKNIILDYTSSDTAEGSLISSGGILVLDNNNITYTNTTEESSTKKYTLINNKGTLNSSNNTYNLIFNSSNRDLRGLYSNKILLSEDDTINVTDGKTSYGLYLEGTNESTIRNLTTNVRNSTTSYGIYKSTAGSTVTINGNTNIGVSDSITSYGIYVNNGTINFETGTINVSGTNSYAVHLQAGTFSIGVEDTSGNDVLDVSVTNPYIKAVGTTTGKGLVKKNGTLNIYDGYITGSTVPFDNTITVDNVQENYKLVQKYDSSTGYNYYILEHK